MLYDIISLSLVLLRVGRKEEMGESLNLSLEQAFAETFSGELDVINQELTESVFNMLTDGVLSSLPIAKCFVGLARTGANIRDYLFAKKDSFVSEDLQSSQLRREGIICC